MLYASLDVSCERLDFHLLDGGGATVEVGAAPPDADGLHGLTRRLVRHDESIQAAIQGMSAEDVALANLRGRSVSAGRQHSARHALDPGRLGGRHRASDLALRLLAPAERPSYLG